MIFDGIKKQVEVEGVTFEYGSAFDEYTSACGFIDISRCGPTWVALDYADPRKPTFDLGTESGWGDFRAHLRAKRQDAEDQGHSRLHDRWGVWAGDPEEQVEGWR